MVKHSGGIESGGRKNPSLRKTAAAMGDLAFKRDGGTGQFAAVFETQVEAVLAAVRRSGLLHEKNARIGGRISPALVRQAKARTGIETDTDLIEFALATIALDDKFAESFKAVRGTVDPDLKLGF